MITMKQIKILSTAIILVCGFMFSTANAFSQNPPPPPSNQGGTGNVPGGGAPIGSGVLILVALGAGYAAKKAYKYRRMLSE